VSSLIGLKYLHLPSNLVINIFTFTDNVLELNVNLEKYIFYMHYPECSKPLAARILADIYMPTFAIACSIGKRAKSKNRMQIIESRVSQTTLACSERTWMKINVKF